ncbi:hypothetical protein [Murinocardiopsis flavida]|nr:hypothetical protein [Murinocardiopsis flavida]
MSDRNDPQPDPASSTQMFRQFVSENNEPEAAPRRPIVPYLLIALVVVVAIGIIASVVMMWS